MISISFQNVDSTEHHLKTLFKEVETQFTIYKDKKLVIDNCSSFDEYYESMRLNKDLIIDYHNISEYDFDEYHYVLILIYLVKNKDPISYYVSICVEKNLKDHTSLLSLRYEELKKAESMYQKYQKVFEKKNDVLLLKEILKDVKKNEWDLY